MRKRGRRRGRGTAWLGLALSLCPFLFLAVPDLDAPRPAPFAPLEDQDETAFENLEARTGEAVLAPLRVDPNVGERTDAADGADDAASTRPSRGPELAGPRSLLELAGVADGFACPPKVALRALRSGHVEAVLLAEPLPPEVWRSDLAHAPVGRWAPVLIRHRDQPVTDLTRGQFDHLLHRRIRDWSAIGSTPGRIEWRVGGSLDVSTYAGLAQRLGGASRPRREVLASVSEEPTRLGLLGVRSLDLGLDEQNLVSVDGVHPSRYTIATGSYAPGVRVFAVVRAGPDHSPRLTRIQTLLDRSAGLAR